MPEYETRVALVDAVTTDPDAQDVLTRYPAQYVPTSVFVGSDGQVVETFVGPLSAEQMRAKLDALLDR